MSDIANEIAKILLETQALKLSPNQPFTWSSGWKSPIYCDNRITLSYPEARTFIKKSLAALILEKFPDVEGIAGVATAGIAQGALVADELGLPFLYVRPKPKEHGMQNCIEGRLEQNQKIVLVEDLISTGGSSIKAAQNINNEGGKTLGIVAIFTYEFEIANQTAKQANIPFYCLSNYTSLIQLAVEKNIIKPSEVEHLTSWRINPSEWNN